MARCEGIEEGPILRPTEQQFGTFRQYVNGLFASAEYAHVGAIKVVPPPSFRAESLASRRALNKLSVANPIEQQVCGSDPVYQLELKTKKSLTLPVYRDLAEAEETRFPAAATRPVEEVERFFWANLHRKPPLYGADIHQSLFRSPPASAWNMRALDSLLADLLGGRALPGINVPYLYVGAFRTMFAWHVEDFNLASANYLHCGSPKLWYVIGRTHTRKFEQWVRARYPRGFVECAQFLRHKTTLVDPYLLKAEMPELHIERHVQREGEMMLLPEGSYHCGFNLGFNVAEAVNFATDAWLPHFLAAKACLCQPKNLRIDPLFLLRELKAS